jgi:hypothetical protein
MDLLNMRKIFAAVIAACLAAQFIAAPSFGADEQDMQKLAKDSQNPVAPMATLPFKNNFYFDEGPRDRFGYTLDIQPVYPVTVGDWNIINRLIAPIVYQPNLATWSNGRMGLGDINDTVFFSPAVPMKFHGGDLLWGAGPMMTAPSSTNKLLGQQKWCAGPSGVVVWTPGRWVMGTLAYNQWSFAGVEERQDVNMMTVQYFVNYNFDRGWFVASSPINEFDWNANLDNRFLIPLGGGVGRVFPIGKQPVSVFLGGYYDIARPLGQPDWQVVFTFTLLFPQKRKE